VSCDELTSDQPWNELTSDQQGRYQVFATVAARQLIAAIVNGRGRV
jgi:hypothetical protein